MPLSPRVPDLGALDVLLSVARLGSLGLAAKEHGVSQPAVSSRIRYVEQLLGLALVERSSRGSTLTPAGSLVVDWARDVLGAASVLDAGIAALRAERGSRLDVTASLTVAEYLVPTWLDVIRTEHPGLTVSLEVANSTDVARLVLEGRCDLGFVEGPTVPEHLSSRPVGRDRLVLVVPPRHPWARGGRAVSAAELAGTALITREAGSGTRNTLEQQLSPHVPLAPPLVELSSTTAVRSAVVEHNAPAVLSSLAVTADLFGHRLVEVAVPDLDLHRVLRAVWPGGQRLLGPARELLTIALRRAPAPARGRAL